MERLRPRTEAHAEAMPAAGTTFEIAIAGGHRTKANRARVRLACYAPGHYRASAQLTGELTGSHDERDEAGLARSRPGRQSAATVTR